MEFLEANQLHRKYGLWAPVIRYAPGREKFRLAPGRCTRSRREPLAEQVIEVAELVG
jgi:hypothetical protein